MGGYGTKTLDKVFGNSVRIREKHYLQYFKEAEYRKMLLDNELIVEYLQANGGAPDGTLEPHLLQRIVNSYAFSK